MASLYFKGKSAVWNHHLSVPYHTLNKDNKKTLKGENDSENLIIEGDNLLALKALLPKYQGRIKCIYIDPPYNTGNEGWVYNDNVNSPQIKDWIGSTIGKDDLTKHDKWLCMMVPRLKLLRELLSDKGVIFISIDDNEFPNLKLVMDDIFHEKNFIGSMVRKSKIGGGSDSKYIVKEHEYLLAYAKNTDVLPEMFTPHNEEYLKRYKEEDENGRFFWDTFARPGLKNPINYDIIAPDGKIINGDWIRSKDRFEDDLENEEIRFLKKTNNTWSVQFKQYLNEDGKKPRSLSSDLGSTIDGKKDIKNIFGNAKIFPYPKPVKLIKFIVDIVTEEDDIILDSFAGSGTTAQAVLELNRESGNRKFILVQISEKIKNATPAYKAGYRFVHEITQKRVEKVIKRDKIKTGFTYYNLGPSIDADSILAGKLPTYEDFAKYAFYLATGKNHPDEKKIKEKDYFVGKSGNESIYLLYKKDINVLKNLSITLDWAEQINKTNSGKKIVYAPACFLDDEYLEKFNIQFVSIPYNLLEKK